jgi:transglutaminase-like putative cysteine protease
MIRTFLVLTAGIALMTFATLSVSAQTTTEPSGAPIAFTSKDPAVKQALSLMNEGKFKEAKALLSADDSSADASATQAREELKEVIRRTLQDYSLSPAGLLAKLKKDIPDVTAEDLENWRKAGDAQYRMIDGQVVYFNREPQNIYLFCKEAKDRRDANAKKKDDDKEGWTLVKHLQHVIDEAEKTGKTEVLPIRHRLTYTLTVDANRPGAKEGSLVRCWLLFPQEYRQQKNVTLVSSEPSAAFVAPSAIDGKTHIAGGAPQRTVYFEQRITDPTKPITFKEVIEYDSYAYYPILKDELCQPLPADWNGAYLGERAPHIAFTPQIRETVAKIVGDEKNPLAKVRKIFHWCSDNIPWHAEEEYTTIPSLAQAAFARKKGDCGVQGTLFTTMCRIAGVPARWQSGWETKRTKSSMHDWSEVYIEPWGWLPMDASYGVQKDSDDPKVRDFYIGHQDSYRTIVNLDYGRPLMPPKQSTLRSEPLDFQRGEVEIDGRNLYFDEWDYSMKIEWLTDEK